MTKYLVKLFIAWRVGLVLFLLVAMKLVTTKVDFLGGGASTGLYFTNPLLWAWANFDGVHYISIAEKGYLQFQQAFFPFYPMVVRFFARLTGEYLITGLFVSNLSFLAALYLFFKLIILDFKKNIAKRAIFYLLVFPTSFYFGSFYTESLFLLLIVGSFYSARKGNWLIAGLLGGLASVTRLIGIFLFPALIVEWYLQSHKESRTKIKDLLPLFLISLGLIFYMWYLKKTTGDPLYFFHMQPLFGAERSGDRIILLYQVFWRYLKMIFTTKLDILYFAVWLEFLSSVLFLILTLFSLFRLRTSYSAYMLFAYLAPTLTGTFSSMPRYVLVLFPGFIILSLFAEKHRWLKIAYPIVCVLLLAVSTILFGRGYWVS